MSKHYRIKWTENDEKELRRVVKNFNAKLYRVEKKIAKDHKRYMPMFWDSEKEDFTTRLSVRQIKELINTRADLKREINALKRFSKKGAEEFVELTDDETKYTLITTKWQRAEMNKRLKRINKRRETRLKEIETTEVERKGEGLGYTLGQLGMGDINSLEYKPIKLTTWSMEQKDVKWKFRTILAESQLEYFNQKDYELRENYIKGIKENYNYNNVKDIIKHIENMPIQTFLRKFYANDYQMEIASPDGRLDLKHAEYEGYEEELRAIWLPNNKYRHNERTTDASVTKKLRQKASKEVRDKLKTEKLDKVKKSKK